MNNSIDPPQKIKIQYKTQQLTPTFKGKARNKIKKKNNTACFQTSEHR